MTVDSSDIVVVVSHVWGDCPLLYTEWLSEGPGERVGVRPIAAFHRVTKEELPLEVIPIIYRNDALAQSLILLGMAESPWEGWIQNATTGICPLRPKYKTKRSACRALADAATAVDVEWITGAMRYEQDEQVRTKYQEILDRISPHSEDKE